ncbi:MAG: hypothetical protein AB7T86_11430 [Xanthobacteraceae bacterium]
MALQAAGFLRRTGRLPGGSREAAGRARRAIIIPDRSHDIGSARRRRVCVRLPFANRNLRQACIEPCRSFAHREQEHGQQRFKEHFGSCLGFNAAAIM